LSIIVKRNNKTGVYWGYSCLPFSQSC